MRPLASLGYLVARLAWPWQPSTQIGLVDASGGFVLPLWTLSLGGAAIVALVLFVVAARRRLQLRPAAADVAWCVVPLVPVLNLVPLGYTTLVAERFLSLPLIGMAAFGVRGLVAARLRRPRIATAFSLAGAGLVAAFALVSAAYVPAFRSNATLWAHELQLQPRNPLLHLYAARAAAAEGRIEDALRAARTSYATAASSDGRTDAAVTWAQLRLQSAGPGELVLVGELRGLFDALAAGNGPVHVDTGGLHWDLVPTPEHRLSVTRAMSFRNARAVAHARTGSYNTAASLFLDLVQDDRSAAAYANLARMQACARVWSRANATLNEGLRIHPGDLSLLGLHESLQRGEALESSPPADPELQAAAWGQLWLELGLALRARQMFEALGREPQQPDAVLVRALTAAALGDPTGARRRVEALRRAVPARAADCDAVSAEIDRLSGAATPARRIDPNKMFE
jgi:tetratricopeptide (TPR) repeat protein